MQVMHWSLCLLVEIQKILSILSKRVKREKLTIGLTGGNNSEMSKLCDYLIQVPSKNTARIQEAHILIGHIICGSIEEGLFAKI